MLTVTKIIHTFITEIQHKTNYLVQCVSHLQGAINTINIKLFLTRLYNINDLKPTCYVMHQQV